MILLNASIFQLASINFGVWIVTLYGLSFLRIEILQKYKNLLQAAAELTIIFAFVCYCEFGEYFNEIQKEVNSNHYGLVLLLFALICILTIKKSNQSNETLAPMNRLQTEEWKGWMQFLFLIYHFFNVKFMYNFIRCLVSSYAFLTGYGNFKYFIESNDFSFKRFVMMMWRLNFSWIILMITQNQPGMLYYIVPLHCFYFVLTFLTLAIKSSWNTNRWKLSSKIMVVYGIIWLIWDSPYFADSGFNVIFTPLYPFLAYRGTLFEWHFRSYLDHYSTLFGILFAANEEKFMYFFNYSESRNKWQHIIIKLNLVFIVAIILYFWLENVLFLQSKFDYNEIHPYTVFIPIFGYLLFRNIVPSFRNYYSTVCVHFGKITLETYILQYHIFLSGHAATLLGYFPHHRLLNFFFSFTVLTLVSEWLYRVTLRLRVEALGKLKNFNAEFLNLAGNLMITIAAFLLLSAYFTNIFYASAMCCACTIIWVVFLNKKRLPGKSAGVFD